MYSALACVKKHSFWFVYTTKTFLCIYTFLVFHARHMLQDGGMIKKTKKVSGPFVQLYNYIAVVGPLCIILLVAEKNSVKKVKKFFLFFSGPLLQ